MRILILKIFFTWIFSFLEDLYLFNIIFRIFLYLKNFIFWGERSRFVLRINFAEIGIFYIENWCETRLGTLRDCVPQGRKERNRTIQCRNSQRLVNLMMTNEGASAGYATRQRVGVTVHYRFYVGVLLPLLLNLESLLWTTEWTIDRFCVVATLAATAAGHVAAGVWPRGDACLSKRLVDERMPFCLSSITQANFVNRRSSGESYLSLIASSFAPTKNFINRTRKKNLTAIFRNYIYESSWTRLNPARTRRNYGSETKMML